MDLHLATIGISIIEGYSPVIDYLEDLIYSPYYSVLCFKKYGLWK